MQKTSGLCMSNHYSVSQQHVELLISKVVFACTRVEREKISSGLRLPHSEVLRSHCSDLNYSQFTNANTSASSMVRNTSTRMWLKSRTHYVE